MCSDSHKCKLQTGHAEVRCRHYVVRGGEKAGNIDLVPSDNSSESNRSVLLRTTIRLFVRITALSVCTCV